MQFHTQPMDSNSGDSPFVSFSTPVQFETDNARLAANLTAQVLVSKCKIVLIILLCQSTSHSRLLMQLPCLLDAPHCRTDTTDYESEVLIASPSVLDGICDKGSFFYSVLHGGACWGASCVLEAPSFATSLLA